MNNTLIVIVVLILAVVAGAYYFMTTGQKGNAGDSMMEDGAETTGSTLAALMAGGQSMECTFQHVDGTNVSSGTVYFVNGAERIRGDFTLTQGTGGPMDMHMIRDGGYNNLWGTAFPQGIKTAVTEESKGKLFDSQDGASVPEDTQYNCKPWTVDESKFQLPSGIEFIDMSAQMGIMMDANVDSTSEMKEGQCAACDQLPEGAARTQCLTALRC